MKLKIRRKYGSAKSHDFHGAFGEHAARWCGHVSDRFARRMVPMAINAIRAERVSINCTTSEQPNTPAPPCGGQMRRRSLCMA
jgi:hypothetical protein